MFGLRFFVLFVAFLSFSVAGCSARKTVELKSPCTSKAGGPCERFSVNDWWLKDNDIQKRHILS